MNRHGRIGSAMTAVVLAALAALHGCRSEAAREGSRGQAATRAQDAPAGAQPIAGGVCSMVESGGGGHSRRVRYAAVKDPATFECGIVLAVEADDGAPVDLPAWRYALPVGQEQLLAIYPRRCGQAVGDVMVIKLTFGAGALKTILVGLDPAGRFSVLFQETSRFDADILDLTGDSVPDVCLFRGDLGPGDKTAVLYEWNGKVFAPTRSFRVPAVHSYLLRGAAAQP